MINVPIRASKEGHVNVFSGKGQAAKGISEQRLYFGAQGNALETTPSKVLSKRRFSFRKIVMGTLLGVTLTGLGGIGYRLVKALPVIQTQTLNPVGSTPEYQAKNAEEKQALLWQQVLQSPYQTLPKTNSVGITGGTGIQKLDNFLKIFDFRYLRKTFDDSHDVRPARDKLFHPFGSVAKVQIISKEGHPFSGLFETGGVGLARLSLATHDGEYSPGIGLKFLVDGKPSANIMAIPSLDPQKSRDFFERTLLTRFPLSKDPKVKLLDPILRQGGQVSASNELPVNHLAAIKSNGEIVATPNAPFLLEFRPSQVHLNPEGQEDFRESLAKIPTGTILYEIWGRTAADSQEAFHLADIKTLSPFMASSFGDRELYFQHSRQK